jgi:AraC-like DNA-binding protein
MSVLLKYYDEIEKKHGNIDNAAPLHSGGHTYPTPETAREALECAVRNRPHRSLSAIGRDIGYSSASPLYHRFPELCHALAAKRREWREQEDQRVRDVITKALDEEPTPTMREMAGRLGFRPDELRRRFRNLYAALVARRPERSGLSESVSENI